MNRVIGFLLFWVGIGILICLFIHSKLLAILLAALLLLIGYNLFCC